MTKNLFDDLVFDKSSEKLETLIENEKVKIEKIITSGQASKKGFWYDQEWDEFVVVLEGSAQITFETKQVTLEKGDFLYIKAHERHHVSWSDPNIVTLWLAVYIKEDKN